MEPENARSLLQLTQQLRTHWSGIITTHIGYAVVINVAIWSYFVKAYIDSLSGTAAGQPLYIGVASSLSSILLMLWRFYTRYIDSNIAGLYPDFLLCEGILSVPIAHGIGGYLMRAVPAVSPILLDKGLTPEEKQEGIAKLVKSKRIGRRGHLWFDVCTLFLILGMFVASVALLRHQLNHPITVACLIGIGIGFIFTLLQFFFYQREPSRELVNEILASFRETKA